MSVRRRLRLSAFPLIAGVALAACGTDAATQALDPGDWELTLLQARGQTVDWWLYGGDDRINAYLDDAVGPRLAELGVTLNRVPIENTVDAVNRVISEVRAGTDDGSVDMIWINGANFALGVENDLWLEGWASELPNASLLAPDDPTITSDFGVPVEGRESPWSRAAFLFAHDTARTETPPTDFAEILAYATANPGRFTYPAPPDFTGSAFVRQAVQALGEDEAFAFLTEIKPLMWRGGDAFPESEAELNELFGNGQVDLAMSYAPGFVAAAVSTGQFPETSTPFVLESGTLSNVSFVTIPANAGDAAAALVLANVLLEPNLQSIKAAPLVLGVPTVLDLGRLTATDRNLFADTDDSPYVLADFGRPLPELDASEVERLDARWLEEILAG